MITTENQIREPNLLLEKRRAAMARAREAKLARKANAMQTQEEINPALSQLNTIRDRGHKGDVFTLYRAGVGSKIVGVGQTYEEMWANAAAIERIDKGEMLKAGYVFDVMPVGKAQELMG